MILTVVAAEIDRAQFSVVRRTPPLRVNRRHLGISKLSSNVFALALGRSGKIGLMHGSDPRYATGAATKSLLTPGRLRSSETKFFSGHKLVLKSHGECRVDSDWYCTRKTCRVMGR